MKQIQTFSDERSGGYCVHCGGKTETRDHSPSRIFLDNPYPTNLPVLACCDDCNQSFSLDEEYTACFVEAAKVGTTDPEQIERPKISRILSKSKKLRARIETTRKSFITHGGEETIYWEPEIKRLENVALKLARCHAAFELDEFHLFVLKPEISLFPIRSLAENDRNAFEMPIVQTLTPEIGSRAFIEMGVIGSMSYCDWVTAQSGRYRYICEWDGGIRVRGVVSEYLAYIVDWPD